MNKKLLLIIFFLIFTITKIEAIEITNVKVLYNGESNTLWLKAGDHVDIEVTVKGKDERAWIGATIIDPEGDELDLEANYAICEKNFLGGPTTDTRTLSTVITEDMYAADYYNVGLRLVVKLWENCVLLRDCQRKGPDGYPPCKWCRRNGYHMENEIGNPVNKVLPPYMPMPSNFRW